MCRFLSDRQLNIEIFRQGRKAATYQLAITKKVTAPTSCIARVLSFAHSRHANFYRAVSSIVVATAVHSRTRARVCRNSSQLPENECCRRRRSTFLNLEFQVCYGWSVLIDGHGEEERRNLGQWRRDEGREAVESQHRILAAYLHGFINVWKAASI